MAVRLAGGLALMAVALLAGAPQPALATWETAPSGAPTTVSFAAVSVYRSGTGSDDIVVAVGRDSQTGKAVIYRHAGGKWLAETTEMPAESCLVAVSVTSQAAWAVGSQGAGCAGSSATGTPAPLIVRFPGGGEALKTPPPPTPPTPPSSGGTDTTTTGTTTTSTTTTTTGTTTSGTTTVPPPTWQVLPASMLPTGLSSDLRTVALVGSAGYIGDGAGAIRRIDDTKADPTSTTKPVGDPVGSGAPGGTGPAPAQVNSIAMYPDATGVAVGKGQPPSSQVQSTSSQVQIFDLAASGYQPSPFKPNTNAPPPLVSVSATSPKSAIAIEGASAYWEPDANGLWTRVTPIVFSVDHTSLAAVSMVAASSTTVVTAIAGDIGGQGSVWRRIGTASWSRDDIAGSPSLHGVAAVSDSDLWAVGSLGTIIHYYPTPPPTANPPSSPSPTPDPKSPPPAPQPSKTPPSTGPPPAPRSNTPPHTTVDQPRVRRRRHKPGRRSRPAPRLLSAVKVQVQRGRLVITFSLSRRARVAVLAGRGGRTVGRLAWRVYGPGRQQVIVPFVGPGVPAQLHISARPASQPASRAPRPARRAP